MVPTTAEIRKFLTELFNDEELTSLCYDYFFAHRLAADLGAAG
jgi:hypothetical protein